ncbi:rho GTPase-activating protein REN1-like isoform X1 [Medicago truncatula]|nr:rho GTPase-activating protein REN1-like isoform X1 [Medicago truncatula]XP_039688468.1 rho GTPase-activating protein REN1-like isoform X1 [Medicago truncatula]
MYIDSEDDESESEDDDLSYDDYYDDEQDESIEGSDVDASDELVSETNSETGDSAVNDEYDKDHNISYSSSKSSEVCDHLEVSLPQSEDIKSCENFTSQNKTASANDSTKPTDIIEGLSPDQTTMNRSNCPSTSSCNDAISNRKMHRRRTVLGQNHGSKDLSMESIDFLDENEAEVERLEAVKTELHRQIAEEVKINVKLQSYVETRKEALYERRVVLERNVDKLQEQLLMEKSLRATLEAGLEFPPGTSSELSGIDEKTKTNVEEIVLIEADLADLERKVNELGLRLNAQLEWNSSSISQQISSHERNLKNKPDTEVAAISESDRSIKKQDSHFGGAGNENERKPESTSLPNKHSPSSKKSVARAEQGASFTTSTITRLTSKLYFLKDRRSQFSNEIRNMNKGKALELQLPPPSPNERQSPNKSLLRSPNMSRENERQSPVPSPNKSRGFEFYMSLMSPKRTRGSENHSPSTSEKVRGNEDHSPQYSEKLRKSDSQPYHSDSQNESSQLYLKRGRSEGNIHNVDKSQLH